jgi:hypothetical protein
MQVSKTAILVYLVDYITSNQFSQVIMKMADGSVVQTDINHLMTVTMTIEINKMSITESDEKDISICVRDLSGIPMIIHRA